MLERFNVGIDIVNVDKFKKIPYSSNKKFYEKVFLTSEIQYCLKHQNQAIHFAGKFAIKESVKKATGEKLEMLDIETYHSNSKPIVKLRNNRNYRFIVSLSHEEEFAIGVVICEKL